MSLGSLWRLLFTNMILEEDTDDPVTREEEDVCGPCLLGAKYRR